MHCFYKYCLSLLFLCGFTLGAMANVDSLKQALAFEKTDSLQYKILIKIIRAAEKVDKAEAVIYGKQLLDVATKMNDVKKQGYASRVIGRNYLFLAKNDSSLIFLNQSNEFYASVGDSVRVNKNMGNIALIYQRENKYEEASKMYQQIIDFSKNTGDYYSAASSLINLASIYIDQDNDEIAIEKLLEVNEIYGQVPLSDTKQRKSIEQIFPAVNINLGQSYADLDDKEKALKYYQEALDASEKVSSAYNSTYYASYANHSIGDLYAKMALDEEKDDNGDKQKAKNFWENARFYFQNSLEGFRKINDERGETFSLTSLGQAYARTNQIERADKALQEGLELAMTSGFMEEIRDAYESLSFNARNKGDLKSALDYYETFVTYKDSLRNEERDQTMEDIKGKYEADKREAEISRLEVESQAKSRQQTIQLLVFIFSLLGILGLSYALYTRYRLKKQVEAATFERKLNKSMSRFVPKEFINALGHTKITDVLLGDQIEKEVTVLFTDIRNFTSISENLDPKENFKLIKDYAEKMGVIIRRNNGFINQYLGDGIMAIFDGSPDDGLKACIEMQKAVLEFNEEQTITDREIRVGMGLNTGMLVLGIIGDDERHDVALISDTVNTASRMESTTKYLGCKIILSQQTMEKLKNPDDFNLRFVGDYKLHGKALPIYVYECFDSDSEELKALKVKTTKTFFDATEYYIVKDFQKAIKKYNKVLKHNPGDSTSKYYLNKAKEGYMEATEVTRNVN